MDKKTLLLDANFQVQSFISFKKTVKFLINEKVEVVSTWSDRISFGNTIIAYPAILKLKNSVKRNFFNLTFNRRAAIKRDENRCQYCGERLSASQITIDHILPKNQSGITSYLNCVVACISCNNGKGNRTPEQAAMTLLKKPVIPNFVPLINFLADEEERHPDWSHFLPAAA